MNSKPSGDSGEPVEVMVRSVSSRCVRRGDRPRLAVASMNPAEVPKRVMPSASVRSNSRTGSGAPSYSTTVASLARADISQFHIIQPAVVK